MHDLDRPACRVAVRDGRLTLHRWTPGLVARGPEPAGLRTVVAALADLHVLEHAELLVVPVPRAPWDEAAEAVLLDWAPTAGHRRVWLPGRVVDVDGSRVPLHDVASADCPTCGAHWEDGSLDFWLRVRRRGWFPGTCLACGGSLPEWRCQERAATIDPQGMEDMD